MSDTINQNFKIVAKITGYSLRKSADGTEKYVLSGMASNTNIDLTGERMADSALTAMAKSLEVSPVTINNEHGNDWDDDFGEVTKLWVTDTHELMMEAELDPDHYRTKTLIKALDKGKKLGLSIGGVVKSAAMEWFEDLGRKVMTYKDIALFHVAITGTPAVADTWVAPITKSVKDWKETPMPKQEQVTKTDEQVEEVVEATPTETPVENPAETPAPAEEPSEAPEEDTTEESEAEGEPDAKVTPDPETTPVTSEAPEQKDEAPASDEPSPAPAEVDTSEVAKSAVFDSWATADVTEQALNGLFYEIGWQVWMQMASDSKSEAERLSAIKAILDEFGAVAYKVAQALIQSAPAEDLAKSAEAYKAQNPDTVSKSLDDKDAQAITLEKSLAEKTTELETVQKSLTEVTTNRDELDKELTTIKGRKTLAFNEGARKAVIADNHLGSAEKQPNKSVRDAWMQELFS